MNIVTITPKAVAKIIEITTGANQPPAVRISVRGGGCSGFQYSMELANEKQPNDKVFVYPPPGALTTPEVRLVVFVDPISMMYLDGVTVDYLETLTESGFKFDNPNVRSTCGCGQSFSV